MYETTYHYNIYALGKWGKLEPAEKFPKQFDSNKHVGNYAYNPVSLAHSFDENVLPYLTRNVFQLNRAL
jgi:hypothetical protein